MHRATGNRSLTPLHCIMLTVMEEQTPQAATMPEKTMKATPGVMKTMVPMALVLGSSIIVSDWPRSGALADTPPATEPGQPSAAKVDAGGTGKAGLPAVDQYGDPLPAEALARLGTTRFWSGQTAWQVRYASDGARLLVSNWTEVLVYDAASGNRLSRIRPADSLGVNCMSLSPNGKLLAIGTSSSEGKPGMHSGF